MSNSDNLNPIQILINYTISECEFFMDKLDQVWSKFEINKVTHIVPINNQTFSDLLNRYYFELNSKPATQAIIKNVVNHFNASTRFGNTIREVFIRNGFNENNEHFIDLGNKALKISSNGIQEIGYENSPYFYKPQGFKSLPNPANIDDINLLRNFINVKTDSDFRLICSWLLSAINPRIPTPILILQGEQGTSKSTVTKLLRSIIDPNEMALRQCSKDERDLFISAKSNAVIVWDNLSGLPKWASDSLCRLCTGGGFSTRKLFTDTDEVLIPVRRPILLNGIDTIATRKDLIDRSIVIELPLLVNSQRISEKEFWNKFETKLPNILSAIYKAFSFGLANMDKSEFTNLPRMADYARWATTCCNYFDWEKNIVLKDYCNNRNEAIEISIANDNFAQSLLKLLETNPEWTGTTTKLIKELKSISEFKTEIPIPKTLGNRLKRLSPALRELGIEYSFGRKNSGSVYTFCKK